MGLLRHVADSVPIAKSNTFGTASDLDCAESWSFIPDILKNFSVNHYYPNCPTARCSAQDIDKSPGITSKLAHAVIADAARSGHSTNLTLSGARKYARWRQLVD